VKQGVPRRALILRPEQEPSVICVADAYVQGASGVNVHAGDAAVQRWFCGDEVDGLAENGCREEHEAAEEEKFAHGAVGISGKTGWGTTDCAIKAPSGKPWAKL